jgi:hypothetical protein
MAFSGQTALHFPHPVHRSGRLTKVVILPDTSQVSSTPCRQIRTQRRQLQHRPSITLAIHFFLFQNMPSHLLNYFLPGALIAPFHNGRQMRGENILWEDGLWGEVADGAGVSRQFAVDNGWRLFKLKTKS